MLDTVSVRQDPHGIEVIEGIFEPELCSWLLKEARRLFFSGLGFRASSARWDRRVVEDSTPVQIHDLPDNPGLKLIERLRNRGFLRPGAAHAMLYAWEHGSYIPWHDDGHHGGGAVTVYLNDRWDSAWGGHFLYRMPDGTVGAPVVPSFNRGVSNGSSLAHSTTRVEPAAPEPRFTLQVFSKGDVQPAEPV
ncbi:2OG-Fe(II) oxygenase [Tsuneonella sp. HG249]